MALQSYLFFGSANRLYQHVKTLLGLQPDCRFLIFDFRSRHRNQFIGDAQLRADQAGGGRLRRPDRARQSHAGTGAGVSHRRFHFRRRHRRVRSRPRAGILRAGDHRGAPHRRTDERVAARLAGGGARRRRARRPADANIAGASRFRPATSSRGRANRRPRCISSSKAASASSSICGEGRTMRVRSLGRHTTIGEMGLITRRPRSATIQAETASVLYELERRRLRTHQARAAGAQPGAARLCHRGDGRAAQLRQPR